MLPGYPGNTTRAEQPGGIIPVVHSVLAVYCHPKSKGWAFKGTSSPRGRRGINISGVDFWHAVEFSRNGRFLCTCFTRPSGRFPSVLRFRLYQTLAAPISAGAIPPFGFFAF